MRGGRYEREQRQADRPSPREPSVAHTLGAVCENRVLALEEMV